MFSLTCQAGSIFLETRLLPSDTAEQRLDHEDVTVSRPATSRRRCGRPTTCRSSRTAGTTGSGLPGRR